MMSKLTKPDLAEWDQDRRPALYSSLIILLVINNVVVTGRLAAHYRAYYRHERFNVRNIFTEDIFAICSAVCVDVVISNLLASTGFGLGLHSWRIIAEDPNYPQNLSNAFKYVWITMILTGPTFTFIKLTLLFYYRRLFLVNQRWLKISWWGNFIYVMLWLIGSTGFYLFQCWPPQWYFMQYYAKYGKPPPYPIDGQCNATTVVHVAIPLIFGLASDVVILLLPMFTIKQLQMSGKAKLGLLAIFSIGTMTCALDMSRIIELFVDTDDKIDPSYGVVVFLCLTAGTEVTALICACLPVIIPTGVKEYQRRHRSAYLNYGYGSSGGSRDASHRQESHLFSNIEAPRNSTNVYSTPIKLNEFNYQMNNTDPITSNDSHLDRDKDHESIEYDLSNGIWIERNVDVDVRSAGVS